jgi:hypothetical protein
MNENFVNKKQIASLEDLGYQEKSTPTVYEALQWCWDNFEINKIHVFRGKKRESFRALSSVVGPENIDGNIVNTYADSNSFKDCMSNLLDNFITLIYLIR